jgi:hypothetical protein
MILLKVNDAIRVLDNRAVCGTSLQASWLGAVHALVLAHEPLQTAIRLLVLVEEDQIPIVPAGFRHGLQSVVEGRLREGHVVPLDAGHFASLATDAGGGIDQFADGFFTLCVFPGNTSRVTAYFLNA